MPPRWAALLGAAFLLVAGPARSATVPELPGYRMGNYESPVPATLHGARVLTTAAARDLWRARAAIFVDVLPAPPRPKGLPPGTLWVPKKRRDIPGSIWLPDVGYGALAAPMQAYLAENLARASGFRHDRLLVFYCRAQCWQSWNAAKRALALGYTRVAWYPDGTNGWATAGLPLAPATPEPRPDVSE